jgi:hypothetical protein
MGKGTLGKSNSFVGKRWEMVGRKILVNRFQIISIIYSTKNPNNLNLYLNYWEG